MNAWLGDASRLKTPYELEVRELLPAPVVSADLPAKLTLARHQLAAFLLAKLDGVKRDEILGLAAEYASQLAEFDDIADTPPEVEELIASLPDADELTEMWKDEMIESRTEALQDLVLVDRRSGTPVSHRDVGIGVSQVLPVLVAAYASLGRLVAIEQPEIHLHPELQAELGDVILGSALGRARNTFLVETHSEHLLLRIMRRIRETTTGELPSDAARVCPDDVMVLFVEPDGSRSIVREMPLNERGELVRAWPGGFFEEDLREIF